jgi:uncharacterized membrane protein (UPF0127 family)
MSPSSRTKRRKPSLLIRVVFAGIVTVAAFYVGWWGTYSLRTYLGRALPSSVEAAAGTSTSNTAPTSAGSTAAAPSSPPPAAAAENTVTIDGNIIDVDVSTTTAEIDQGLQNRPTLGASQGMLFIFNHSAIYRFWMPNMNFPLDMIWIGSNMQVVDITKDAPPLPDPTNPIWYTPSVPAQYVLEVNADYSDEHDIQPGDAVTFSLANS